MKYERGNSIIHKIDPRTKLVYLLFAIVFAVYFRNPTTLALLLLFAATVFKSAHLKFSQFLSETKMLMVFVTLLFSFQYYLNGFAFALVTALFLLDIFLLTTTFIRTTHPSDLANSLVNWKVPYEFAFLFSLTLRFVPVIQRDLGEVRAAQASRGHRLRYPWDFLPLALPLLHKLFRQAFDLSVSLETRAFSADRTFFRKMSLTIPDYLLMAGLACFSALWLL